MVASIKQIISGYKYSIVQNISHARYNELCNMKILEKMVQNHEKGISSCKPNALNNEP